MKPGLPEILLIILVIVLLFGGRKIPELMKGLGSGIREFKKASNGTEEEEPKKPAATTSSEPKN